LHDIAKALDGNLSNGKMHKNQDCDMKCLSLQTLEVFLKYDEYMIIKF